MQNSVNTSKALQQKLIENQVFKAFTMQADRKKPDKATGKLLANPNMARDLIDGSIDTVKDTVNLATALKTGKSTDNKLGRLNDLGLKLGGAGIASYLYTQKFGKGSKLMEFVGFGVFLSSMYLWPKLFISKPIKARYGFDIDRKYIDNQGNKKKFFQDNQYLPWDIWDKKEIDKIADKMGVDKNLAEREEFTKKKMQKVALQANTLNMLTAGFGTPLMAALICDKLEPVVNKANLHITNKKTKINAAKIANSDAIVKASKEESLIIGKNINSIFKKASNIEEASIEITKILLQDCIPQKDISEALDKDILNILQNSRKIDTEKASDFLKKALFNSDRTIINAEGEKQILKAPTIEQIKEILESTDSKIENILKAFQEKGLITDAKGFKKVLNEMFGDKKIVSIDTKKANETIIKLYANNIKPFVERLKGIGNLVEMACGETPDSIATATYKAIAKEFMEEMNLSFEQLEKIRLGGKGSLDEVVRIIQEKASDDAIYKSFIENLVNKRTKYEQMSSESLDVALSSGKKILGKCSETLSCDELSNLRKVFANSDNNTVIDAFEAAIKGSSINLDGILVRILAGADFEKRLLEEDSLKFIQKQADACSMSLDEFVNMCRNILYTHNMNNFQCKNEIAEPDIYFRAIETLFGKETAKATREVFENGNIGQVSEFSIKNGEKHTANIFEKGKELIKNIALSIKNAGNPDHTVEGIETGLNMNLKYKAIGVPLDEFLANNSKQLFNNKKWFKIFAPAFGVLAGVTVLSQFFFGKMKDEHLYKKQEGVNNVSGK
ncbi:MAG: hypothetical protein E7Z91_05460 [Cyanobacteria bacterium SIG30]|nr:hypothetical protein [Cyanobacteria bacterium SIG30]